MTPFGAATHISFGSPRAARLLLSFSLIIGAHFYATRFAHAQDVAETPDEVIRVETNLVSVPVVVTNARGQRVHGLTQSDFDVLDEGRGVELSYFASGAERVALIFLLDASGSTREIIETQREAAIALYSRFGKGSRVSVVPFQETPHVSLPFTANLEDAAQAFRLAATPNRRTAIFDAALFAARAFGSTQTDPTERRIVILISDGLDTASSTAPHVAINEALLHNASFYVIHLPLYAPRDGRLAPRAPSKGFRDLAEKTGGKFFVVGDVKTALLPRAQYDFQPVFQAIDEDLRGQYVLGYHAGDTERTGRQHRVEVRLRPQSGRKLRVRALRDSYVLTAPRAANE